MVCIENSLYYCADHAGTKQSGVALNDVILPPWAKGDTQEFIRKHREVCVHVYVHVHT